MQAKFQQFIVSEELRSINCAINFASKSGDLVRCAKCFAQRSKLLIKLAGLINGPQSGADAAGADDDEDFDWADVLKTSQLEHLLMRKQQIVEKVIRCNGDDVHFLELRCRLKMELAALYRNTAAGYPGHVHEALASSLEQPLSIFTPLQIEIPDVPLHEFDVELGWRDERSTAAVASSPDMLLLQVGTPPDAEAGGTQNDMQASNSATWAVWRPNDQAAGLWGTC